MITIELHVMQGSADLGPIPSYQGCDLSPVFCDYGSISFKYPTTGKKYASLLKGKDEIEIVPFINGKPVPELGGLVQEISSNDVAEVDVVQFSGLGYLKLMDEARVYPAGWPQYNPLSPSWKFNNASAGKVMGQLIQIAQTRGALPGVTYSSFSTAVDSAGKAWSKLITMEIKPGATLTAVLKDLKDKGLCEFKMVGRDLRLYNVDGMGVDQTLNTNPLTFRKGRDLRDSPRKVSSRDVATAMLSAGKDDSGLYHDEVDAVAVAGRRRIEGYVSAGNITDAGTLDAYTELSLAQVIRPKMEKTHGLEFVKDKSPQPLRDFNVGDWSYSDVDGSLERLRIKQWVLSAGDDGKVSGSVTMNDLFAEQEEKLAKRLADLANGSTISGESRATPAEDPALTDGIAPRTPTGLVLTSTAYQDNGGITSAQVTATWQAVTFNSDNSVIDDLAGYMLRWRPADITADQPVTYDNAQQNNAAYNAAWDAKLAAGWMGKPGDSSETIYPPDYDQQQWTVLTLDSGTLTASWSPVATRTLIWVQVLAYDRVGNKSAWSGTTSIVTGYDITPPPTPSAALVDNYLGLIRVRWDGKSQSGTGMSPDFNFVEVHVSTANNFTPSASTLVDTLTAAGSTFLEVPYGETRYARLVSVDHTGNKSDPGAIGSGSAQAVVGADILQGAIDAGKIADGAVTNVALGLGAVTGLKIADFAVAETKIADLAVSTAKIKDLAVSTAKIDNLAVGTAKIADLAVSSAKIALLAVQTANIGDLAVNNAKIGSVSVGKVTAGILSAEVTLSGRIATALTGTRVEFNASGIYAYNGTTRTFFVDSNTGSVDALGTFRTSSTNGRQVVVTANLSEVGGTGNAINQAGIIFPSTNSNMLRFGELYDNGTSIVIDSPSLSTTAASGISRTGSSLGVHSEGIYAFTEGATTINAGNEALVIRNDGYNRLGRLDIYGRGVMQLSTTGYSMESAGTGGSRVYGDTTGGWGLGNKNSSYASVTGGSGSDAASWRMGSDTNRVQGIAAGTWYIGHSIDQAVFSNGNDLTIRGRRAGGNVIVGHVTGSSFQVYGDGNNNASMGVNGAFAAISKNFVIPHPLDPKKKLVHGVTESPVHGVEYWGESTVGKRGRITVRLPRYFEALTTLTGRAVILTPLGSSDGERQLSTSEVENGKFTVTGNPGQKFYWLVKAGRSDTTFEVEPNEKMDEAPNMEPEEAFA